MKTKRIDIGVDFSPNPDGRYDADGPNSGERFRDTILIPALKTFERVIVELDSVNGFTHSFLDEAFGGTVSILGLEFVLQRLHLAAVDRAYLLPTIRQYMHEAEARRGTDA